MFYLAQVSTIERIVADTARLVKQTGLFFDRYSETHRASVTSGKNIPSTASGDHSAAAGYYCMGCEARRGADETPQTSASKNRAKVSFPGEHRQYQQRSSSVGDNGWNNSSSSSSKCGTAVGGIFTPVASVAATTQPSPWGGAENSGSFLGRTVRRGSENVATGGAFAAPTEAVRELDDRCYTLLEANAQLCLRLQGLALEFAGLTRELLASGSGEVSHFSSYAFGGGVLVCCSLFVDVPPCAA